MTTLTVNTGMSLKQTFLDIAGTQHFIAISNGHPGLDALDIIVNNKIRVNVRLADNERKTFDKRRPLTCGPSVPIIVADLPPGKLMQRVGRKNGDGNSNLDERDGDGCPIVSRYVQ